MKNCEQWRFDVIKLLVARSAVFVQNIDLMWRQIFQFTGHFQFVCLCVINLSAVNALSLECLHFGGWQRIVKKKKHGIVKCQSTKYNIK